jgi:hypothetical protein
MSPKHSEPHHSTFDIDSAFADSGDLFEATALDHRDIGLAATLEALRALTGS